MYRMSRKNTAVDCCYSGSTAVFLLEHPVCIDLLLPWMSKLWVALCAKLFLQCDAWLWPGAIARYCKPTWLNLEKVVVAVKWGFMLISFYRVVVMEKMLERRFTYFQPNLCLYPVKYIGAAMDEKQPRRYSLMKEIPGMGKEKAELIGTYLILGVLLGSKTSLLVQIISWDLNVEMLF